MTTRSNAKRAVGRPGGRSRRAPHVPPKGPGRFIDLCGGNASEVHFSWAGNADSDEEAVALAKRAARSCWAALRSAAGRDGPMPADLCANGVVTKRADWEISPHWRAHREMRDGASAGGRAPVVDERFGEAIKAIAAEDPAVAEVIAQGASDCTIRITCSQPQWPNNVMLRPSTEKRAVTLRWPAATEALLALGMAILARRDPGQIDETVFEATVALPSSATARAATAAMRAARLAAAIAVLREMGAGDVALALESGIAKARP